MRIPKRKIKSALHIDQWVVEGYLHLLPGEDIASFSANKRHRFIPVTSARILRAGSRVVVAKMDLLEVNSKRVVMFYPLPKTSGEKVDSGETA